MRSLHRVEQRRVMGLDVWGAGVDVVLAREKVSIDGYTRN